MRTKILTAIISAGFSFFAYLCDPHQACYCFCKKVEGGQCKLLKRNRFHPVTQPAHKEQGQANNKEQGLSYR